jgi:mRNA-degrading endonuclease YafQ of YafQ-DinJ toxin-antitoxin module
MVINPKLIKYFELTKIFKKEVKNFVQNNPSLEDKIYDCILNFEENLYLSKHYRKPLKNGEFKKFDIHELQLG